MSTGTLERPVAALRLATSTILAPARVALVNSFASGGALVSLVLRAPVASAAHDGTAG